MKRHAAVWEALLPTMGLTALLRNLGKLSEVGLVAPGSDAERHVVARLGDGDALRTARVHPLHVLVALTTYASGHGVRGRLSWTPSQAVRDALDAAFYATFQMVKPTGKRTLLALDVSGSMTGGTIAGLPGITPRVGSAAMALVTAAVEPEHEVVGFTDGLTRLGIGPRCRLETALRTVAELSFGPTDCAAPMIWAAKKRRRFDTFCVYTDSETWAGPVHPVAALRAYREATGIAAKLVVVGMVSNGFSIADPSDLGMLDVVGFDTSTPAVIADFATGALLR